MGGLNSKMALLLAGKPKEIRVYESALSKLGSGTVHSPKKSWK